MEEKSLIREVNFDSHLHISYGQLKTYLTCPQKYLFQYVRGLPWEFIPEYYPFGRSVHKAAEVFYRTLKETGQRITLDELVNHFIETWIRESQANIRFRDGQDKDTLREKGIQLMKVFYENVSPQNILGVEVPFSVDLILEDTGEILPYKLGGIFDLIESDEEENVIVVELKTGVKRYTEDQIDLDLQGTLYSYALNQMGFRTNGGETLVRYDQLLKSKYPTMETYYAVRGKVHYQWAYHLMRKVLGAIEQEVYYPIPGWQCRDCPFGLACQQEQ
jgi:CRISPR/Cas system-associated exonuclease Cas4 (RecB family)